jgi:hypothetical protein
MPPHQRLNKVMKQKLPNCYVIHTELETGTIRPKDDLRKLNMKENSKPQFMMVQKDIQ